MSLIHQRPADSQGIQMCVVEALNELKAVNRVPRSISPHETEIIARQLEYLLQLPEGALLTTRQAAERMGVNPSTVCHWMDRTKMVDDYQLRDYVQKIGPVCNRLFIRQRDLITYLGRRSANGDTRGERYYDDLIAYDTSNYSAATREEGIEQHEHELQVYFLATGRRWTI